MVGDIELALFNALEVANECKELGDGDYVNVLCEGRAGFGKTARIKQWANENNINLFSLDAKTLDPTDLSGIPAANADRTQVVRLATTELDALDRPNSVLFLDELNRADPTVRGILLNLIKDHEIIDPRTGSHIREFKNLLFTVAAVNPSDNRKGGSYHVIPLDPAELSRFRRIQVGEDKELFRSYMASHFDKLSAKAQKPETSKRYSAMSRLSDTLLRYPEFHFDTATEEAEADRNNSSTTNPRSLMAAVKASHGEKNMLIEMWSDFCNPKHRAMVERALKDYKDEDNIPNSVFKKKAKTAWEKFKEKEDLIAGGEND